MFQSRFSFLAEKEIDYAFFCCGGVYNMGLKEAAECEEMVCAKLRHIGIPR